MVYYEPRVTQADKDHITHRLSKYVMDIRHDHELYRHLHCYWPDDPIGPNNCSFDVITAPGSITIYGDWMSAFTLRRYGDQDMLLDFCNDKGIIFDPENVPGEHYTLEWVRTCMALQWAARTYAAAQSYKKQKQIHRYLTTERHMFLGDLTLPEKPPVVGI